MRNGKENHIVLSYRDKGEIKGDLDIWEGEYTYRCILTNDYKSSARDIVEFYNLHGSKERIFDDMNESKPLYSSSSLSLLNGLKHHLGIY